MYLSPFPLSCPVDDTRIRGSIPTLKYLLDKGAKVLITSHLGRPKGGYEAKFSLAPIAPRLAELLGVNVPLVSDSIGAPVTEHVATMKVSTSPYIIIDYYYTIVYYLSISLNTVLVSYTV